MPWSMPDQGHRLCKEVFPTLGLQLEAQEVLVNEIRKTEKAYVGVKEYEMEDSSSE